MIMVDEVLHSKIINKGILSPEELDKCLELQKKCACVGLYIPLPNIILEIFKTRSSLLETLVRTSIEDLPDTWKAGKVPWVPSEDSHELMERIKKDLSIPESEPENQEQITKGLNRMGISLTPLEILICQDRLQWERVYPFIKTDRVFDQNMHNVTTPLLGEISFDSKDIDFLSVQAGLVTLEEMKTCLQIKKEFIDKGVAIPLETLFHEVLLIDRSLISDSLNKNKYKMDAILIRFTPEEENAILDKLNCEGRINTRLVCECMHLQRMLANHDLNWSICKILFFKGILKQEEISGILALRKSPRKEKNLRFPGWVRDINQERIFSHLAVANGYITPEQESECLSIQKQCKTLWNLRIPLPFILFKKGYLSLYVINSLINGQSAFCLYEIWDYQVRVLDMNMEEERAFLSRLLEYKLLNVETIKECEELRMKLVNMGLALSAAKILLYSKRIPEELLRSTLQKKVCDMEYLLPLSIPRPLGPEEMENSRIDYKDFERNPLSGVLFGKIAVGEGYVSKENMDTALRLQRYFHEMGLKIKIGEILVFMKCISPSDVQYILKLQAQRLLQIAWPDGDGLTDEDLSLKKFITENRMINKPEMQRCILILNKLKKIGITKSLYQILSARESMGIEALYKIEHALTGNIEL